MNYTEFREKLRKFPVFSIREIEKHFPDFDNRRLVEWQKKGYIQKLRNRYYYFADREIYEPYLFLAANKLYGPSYISLESALSWHGFIPEGVFQITSCTTRKTNSFNSPIATFAYRHLKPSLFLGYQLREWENHRYAIAGPEKTIIDYLYLHSDMDQVGDFKSLRWNPYEIHNRISMEKLDKFETYIDSPALSERLNIFREFIHADT